MGPEPLLSGEARRDAMRVLRDLSAVFLATHPAAVRNPTFADGLAGIAVVHAALDAVLPNVGHMRRADAALEAAIRGVAAKPLGPSLLDGFPGIAWVAATLGRANADELRPIDEALETALDRAHWRGSFDLVSGLSGIGVYALEGPPRTATRRLIARVLERLEESARRPPACTTHGEKRADRLAWRTERRWSPAAARRAGRGRWNLGVAHGTPGVVALLGRIVSADVGAEARRRARALLEAAVRWIRDQELPPSDDGRFPAHAGARVPQRATRLAWCYGDLGVASALLVAARGARDASLEAFTTRLALGAAARSRESSGVVDAGLCHGAAGNAHLFHRLYRATGDDRFADAARTWFARALAMRRARAGFGGFPARVSGGWRSRPGVLTGTGGVALALASAVAERETAPDWSRLLLLP